APKPTAAQLTICDAQTSGKKRYVQDDAALTLAILRLVLQSISNPAFLVFCHVFCGKHERAARHFVRTIVGTWQNHLLSDGKREFGKYFKNFNLGMANDNGPALVYEIDRPHIDALAVFQSNNARLCLRYPAGENCNEADCKPIYQRAHNPPS